jgi:hypothetical protein
MSDKPITLQTLRDMLKALDEIPSIAIPAIAKPRFKQPREKTLEMLMDAYDLSSSIAGRQSGDRRSISYPNDYNSTDSGLLIRYPESEWNFSFTSSCSSVFGFTAHEETEEEKERRQRMEDEKRRVEEEKKQRCAVFAQQVASLSTKPLISLDNPDPKFTTPDYMETLTGWRVWSVSHGKLESLGVNEWWKPRRAVPARCNRSSLTLFGNPHSGDDSPSHSCTCGYWSFKSENELKDVARDYEDIAVVGTVSIWGKVIECENGYRSEYAYPKELWLLKPGLEFLSWTYGVPVRKAE